MVVREASNWDHSIQCSKHSCQSHYSLINTLCHSPSSSHTYRRKLGSSISMVYFTTHAFINHPVLTHLCTLSTTLLYCYMQLALFPSLAPRPYPLTRKRVTIPVLPWLCRVSSFNPEQRNIIQALTLVNEIGLHHSLIQKSRLLTQRNKGSTQYLPDPFLQS